MRYFDMHCDTIGECYRQNQNLRENTLQVSFSHARFLRAWGQVFAVWIPDDLQAQSPADYYRAVYAAFLREVSENADTMLHCKTAAQLEDARQSGRCAALLAVEDARVLGGELAMLEELAENGVKYITLTWNGKNALGCGCMEDDGTGLSAFGKAAVRAMGDLGIAVDVSHINEAGFWDVLRHATGPVLASHANAKAVVAHPRNLTDAQIRALVARGAPMGLTFYSDFLGGTGTDAAQQLLAQIEHVLALGGADILCLGADYDGCFANGVLHIHKSLDGIATLPALAERLQKQGLSGQICQKLFYDNAFFWWKHVLQS